MERRSSRARLFWSIVGTVVVLDGLTKYWAARALVPARVPREVLGDWVRLTLVHNPGAAFGLYLGPYSRWIFIVLTAVALIILGRLYKGTKPGQLLRVVAIGLVCGGAVGNLLDRLWPGSRGVVDFLDLGIGDARWPTFNVADMAVSTGALLLAWVLWSEDNAAPESGAEATPSVPGVPSARATRDTGT
ncbi:MAG TPA: signal peptidase II [Gemmatimonadaceae bacterium]